MLRDRLVCEIGDDPIQCRLLSKPELLFDKALKVAQAMETATKDVQELEAYFSEISLSATSQQVNDGSKKTVVWQTAPNMIQMRGWAAHCR